MRELSGGDYTLSKGMPVSYEPRSRLECDSRCRMGVLSAKNPSRSSVRLFANTAYERILGMGYIMGVSKLAMFSAKSLALLSRALGLSA